jgi:hypothetical protein
MVLKRFREKGYEADYVGQVVNLRRIGNPPVVLCGQCRQTRPGSLRIAEAD